MPSHIIHSEHESSAVFEGDQFWIFDNFYFLDGDCFLMATPARNVQVFRDKSGALHGKPAAAWPRNAVCDAVAFYRGQEDPANWLPPLRQHGSGPGTCRVERLFRPAKRDGKWKLSFTRRFDENQPETLFEMEIDPLARWQATRIVYEKPGEWRTETDTKFGSLAGTIMPVELHSQTKGKDGEATVHMHTRPMSPPERQALKQRVEQAVEQCPPPLPCRWLRRLLQALVIGCPLIGVALLAFTRRVALSSPPATVPDATS
jgi:hypothetical protein